MSQKRCPSTPSPPCTAGLPAETRRGQELEAAFIHHHLCWPGSSETQLVTLAPKSIPILVEAAGAAAALEGPSRLEHPISPSPSPCLRLLGRLWRWWPDCATHRAQRAPGSAHQHLSRSLERAGDGTGAVPSTPKQWGKAHHPCFHCTWSQVGCCPPGLLSRALINCSFFPSPSPQLQGNRVKTRLCLQCDGHTGMASFGGVRLLHGGLDPQWSPRTHTLPGAPVAPRPSPAGGMWPSWGWLLASTSSSVVVTATFCSCKMKKSCSSSC